MLIFLGVYFELNGNRIDQNNSRVSIYDIGENEEALLCRTNKPDCCKINATGEFFYPNEVMVPKRMLSPQFYRDRGEGVVRLNKRADLEIKGSWPPQGLYCCRVPDACGIVQKVCINLVK